MYTYGNHMDAGSVQPSTETQKDKMQGSYSILQHHEEVSQRQKVLVDAINVSQIRSKNVPIPAF